MSKQLMKDREQNVLRQIPIKRIINQHALIMEQGSCRVHIICIDRQTAVS